MKSGYCFAQAVAEKFLLRDVLEERRENRGDMGNRELKITLEFSPTVIDTEGLPLPENIQYLLVFCEKTEAGGKLEWPRHPFSSQLNILSISLMSPLWNSSRRRKLKTPVSFIGLENVNGSKPCALRK